MLLRTWLTGLRCEVLVAFALAACSTAHNNPPPRSAATPMPRPLDAGATELDAPLPEPTPPNMLPPLLVDLPVDLTLDQCDELCLIEAVCSETVTREDYQGGNRCVDNCESYGDEGIMDTEDCLRSSANCAEALDCF